MFNGQYYAKKTVEEKTVEGWTVEVIEQVIQIEYKENCVIDPITQI